MITKYNNKDISTEMMAFIQNRQDLQNIVDRYYEKQRKSAEIQRQKIEEERILKDLEKQLYKKLDKVLEELFK